MTSIKMQTLPNMWGFKFAARFEKIGLGEVVTNKNPCDQNKTNYFNNTWCQFSFYKQVRALVQV